LLSWKIPASLGSSSGEVKKLTTEANLPGFFLFPVVVFVVLVLVVSVEIVVFVVLVLKVFVFHPNTCHDAASGVAGLTFSRFGGG
jgi:hypothetical protein